jgi:hypothetical protein
MEALAGVTASDTGTAGLTVRTAPPVAALEVALIVVVPAETDVASPVAFTAAIPGTDELHVAVDVRFCVLPSV